MHKRIRNTAVAAALAAGLGGASAAQASNWILLQGTEPFGKAHTLQMWGFMQPTYRQVDDSDKFNGKRPIFNTLAPDRKSSSSFSLFRARLGARGVMHPVNDKINYFFLTEFGTNGQTRLADQGSRGSTIKGQLTDASVTFRQFAGGGSGDPWKPGVSLRAGQFKMPLTDEGSRGIMSFDYINFSEVTRQQVLERFVKYDAALAAQPSNDAPDGPLLEGGISGFRDVGIQLFDEIKLSDNLEATWAAAIGNGSSLNSLDNDDNKDLYLRAQVAYVFDGVKRGGPRREDLKLFAWSQMGDRQFDANNDGTFEEYERNRYGAGFHFYKQPYRFSGEYIAGNGMVFDGVTNAVQDPDTTQQTFKPRMAPGDENEFNGWYLEGGYFLIPNKFGVQARFDRLNRMTNSKARHRQFDTWTVGLQYWNHPAKGQFMLNYRIRDLEAPDLPSSHKANKIGNTMGNEIGLQYFMLFKNVALR